MLQLNGRAAAPKLAPGNCLKYMQPTLIMKGEGLISELMSGIVVK